MDFSREKGLFCKAKSVASSFYGFVLWSITLPSTMQIHKQYLPTCPGLKTLVYSPQESPQNPNLHRFILHSYMISPSFVPPSPSGSGISSSSFRSLTSSSSYSSWSSMLEMDDVIGTESGVYLNSITEEETEARMEKLQPYYRNLSRKNQQQCEMRKKYPPPIPLLARTGNLPGHMPWNLTRNYSNGRLILKEERVKHHEYFESHRENGRLILNLVPLDDTVRCCHSVYDEEEEELELELQDLELVEEEEEETEADDKSLEDKIIDETLTGAASSSPVPGGVHKCSTYGGRKTLDSYLSCNANAHINGGGYRARSGSAATLSFTIRPMTTVV